MAVLGIDMYQKLISPHKGWYCAYASLHPMESSCSQFGKDAILSKGIIRGVVLLFERFSACETDSLFLKRTAYPSVARQDAFKAMRDTREREGCLTGLKISFCGEDSGRRTNSDEDITKEKHFWFKPKKPSQDEIKRIIIRDMERGYFANSKKVTEIKILSSGETDKSNFCFNVQAKGRWYYTRVEDYDGRFYGEDNLYLICPDSSKNWKVAGRWWRR